MLRKLLKLLTLLTMLTLPTLLTLFSLLQLPVRGGVKKTFVLLPVKRGGVSAYPKIPYKKILRFF